MLESTYHIQLYITSAIVSKPHNTKATIAYPTLDGNRRSTSQQMREKMIKERLIILIPVNFLPKARPGRVSTIKAMIRCM